MLSTTPVPVPSPAGFAGTGAPSPAPAPTLNALTLSASTIAENSAAGTVVGAVQGLTSGSSLSITDTAGSRFALDGNNVVAGATGTDYETATSHNITLRETLAGATNTPRDTVLAISVTDVAESSFEAETTALLARMDVQPSTAIANAYNAFIAAAKANGYWAKFMTLHIWAAHTEQAALLRWNRTGTATVTGPTFSAGLGFTQTTNGFIDFGETLTNAIDNTGIGGTENLTIGSFCTAQGAATGGAIHLGTYDTAGSGYNARLQLSAHTGGNETARVNDSASATMRVGSTRVGHRTVVRVNGTTLQPYFNGVAGSSVSSSSFNTRATGFVCAFRAGTGYAPVGDRLFASYIMTGTLTAAEAEDLHADLEALRLAVAP